MRRCQSQIRNPTSQISQLGRVSHLSHASQMFAMFPMFPVFPMFAVFAMFPVFPRTRDARKKTKHHEMRNSVSEARASARAHLRVRRARPSTTPSAEAASTPPSQGGELSESGILATRTQNSITFHVSCPEIGLQVKGNR